VSGGRAGVAEYSRTSDYSAGYRGGAGGPETVLLDRGGGRQNWLMVAAATALCLFIVIPLMALFYYLQPGPKFDCEAGYDNWQRGWSKEKQTWCCESIGAACIGTRPLPGSDLLPRAKEEEEEEEAIEILPVFSTSTTTETSTTTTSTSVTGTTTTVTTTTVTTTTITTTAMFNCWAGFENWKHGWSPQKKEWCCRTDGLGCPSWKESVDNEWALGGMAAMFLIGCFLACVYCCIYQCCCRPRNDPVKPPRGGGDNHAEEAKKYAQQEIERRLRERKKRLGHLTVSLMWDTKDDLDLSLELPDSAGHIDFQQKACGGGFLDGDANNDLDTIRETDRPVENIVFPHGTRPPHGRYKANIRLRRKVSRDIHWTVKVQLDDEALIFTGTICTQEDEYIIPFTYPDPRSCSTP